MYIQKPVYKQLEIKPYNRIIEATSVPGLVSQRLKWTTFTGLI